MGIKPADVECYIWIDYCPSDWKKQLIVHWRGSITSDLTIRFLEKWYMPFR